MALQPSPIQTSLPLIECPVVKASELLASQGNIDTLGAIFTRGEVVDFILDLAGYTADRPLERMRLLEPSCGSGDFLIRVVQRLLQAWNRSASDEPVEVALADCIRAVELHHDTLGGTRNRVVQELMAHGIERPGATLLANAWLLQGDFLLLPIEGQFDFVVGNPPYVRQELIPAALLGEYRRRYTALYDRAGLHVPFIERSLSLLAKRGTLGFICADRWMKNRYGGPLRALIAENFHLAIYVDMTDTPAFLSEVLAYPAVTIVRREKTGATRIAHRPMIDAQELKALAAQLLAADLPSSSAIREVASVVHGSEPWLLDSADQLAIVRRLEKELPLLEEVGCKVGIGVATGADKAFIGQYDEMDVEPGRKLALVTTKDIASGEVRWVGQGVINPFLESGALVDLNGYPRLRRYLQDRYEVIAARHCARKSPDRWYKTIDRITPALAKRPKLLIPDIKGRAHVVYEPGELYPHHNLYYVISDDWEMRALQAVLLSEISRLFVATYSTKMHGGFLRFQAQYLRRIRVPKWGDVSQNLRAELAMAAQALDIDACNRAVYKLYRLSQEEISVIGGNG